jgi:hypothetical protein
MTHYSKDYVDTKKFLEKLVVIANDERFRNLSRFNQLRALLNEWDDEKKLELRKKFLKEQA